MFEETATGTLMTSQLFSSMNRFETHVISDLMKNLGHKPSSSSAYHKIISIVNDSLQKGILTQHLVSYMRLAAKLCPYAPEVPTLLKMHDQLLKQLMAEKMPALFEVIRACRDKGLPVPVIVSCEKYMAAAVELQKAYKERYFSISPIIVRGDITQSEPSCESLILSLPVDDNYEALPVKICETCLFFAALNDRSGIIKIDGDLTLAPNFKLNLEQNAALFSAADYIGTPVGEITHDRLWHFGKCRQPMQVVYGKPLKGSWARGALYFLSHHALGKLAHYYMRFPGCLDGELFEDKAVGDVLGDNDIKLLQYVLEPVLGLESERQDRI